MLSLSYVWRFDLGCPCFAATPPWVTDRPMGTNEDSANAVRWAGQLAAAQRGDADAYRLFLSDILPFLRAVARRRCRSDEETEDAVQEALLTIHRVRHTYTPGRPVKPWLAAIADRRAIDAVRRRFRIGRHEVSDDHAYATFADPAANRVEASGSAQTLARMTEGLSPVQKEAIELVKIRELSLVEASAVSGQSVAALKVNIHRAIKKMRARLGGRDRAE